MKMQWVYDLRSWSVKHAPEILTGLGIAGVAGTVVLACRATLKTKEIIENHNHERDSIKNEFGLETSDSAAKIRKLYFRTSTRVIGQFGPVLVLGSLSVMAFLKARGITLKKYTSMVAAYAGLDQSFKLYRERTVDRYGEEVDWELLTGAKRIDIREKETDEDGKVHNTKKSIDVVDEATVTENSDLYVKYITRKNFHTWDPDPLIVESALNAAQQTFTNYLVMNHAVVLNDVYKYLGFKPTKAGMTVGWVYKQGDPDHIGDNKVEFDVRKIKVFMHDTQEWEDGYAINFNVDGPIDQEFEEVLVSEDE